MSNEQDKVVETDPNKLADLMSDPDETKRFWRPEELGAVFMHQMSSPLLFDLSRLGQEIQEQVAFLAGAQGLLLRSFRDLLNHPHPPVELLKMTKDFAKRYTRSASGLLPREVASVLYFLSIASALVRCKRRITNLSDADLGKGLEWSLGRSWLDEESRALLTQAQELLNSGGNPS